MSKQQAGLNNQPNSISSPTPNQQVDSHAESEPKRRRQVYHSTGKADLSDIRGA